MVARCAAEAGAADGAAACPANVGAVLGSTAVAPSTKVSARDGPQRLSRAAARPARFPKSGTPSDGPGAPDLGGFCGPGPYYTRFIRIRQELVGGWPSLAARGGKSGKT